MSSPLPWGCPNCGEPETWTKTVDRDDDGYRIRRLQCVRCGTYWTSEERPIRASFYARASRRNQAKKRWQARQTKVCRWCGGEYAWGTFTQHVRKSSRHRVAVDASRREYHLAYKRRRAAALREAEQEAVA